MSLEIGIPIILTCIYLIIMVINTIAKITRENRRARREAGKVLVRILHQNEDKFYETVSKYNIYLETYDLNRVFDMIEYNKFHLFFYRLNKEVEEEINNIDFEYRDHIKNVSQGMIQFLKEIHDDGREAKVDERLRKYDKKLCIVAGVTADNMTYTKHLEKIEKDL